VLQVRLLGELEVEAAGHAISAPASRRAWELLAWLALNPGEHPRSAVAARFWPDVLDSSARASLRSAAWALRRALGADGEDALVAGRDRIGLRCATDVAAFEAHIGADEPQAAIALCRGPLLADFDEDWVLEARDAHNERVGATLARLAAAASSPDEAVGWARRRLALDPLDEQAARELMRRMVDAGDRAGALAVATRLAERLRSGLGLAISAQTRELVAEIRAAEAGPAVQPRAEIRAAEAAPVVQPRAAPEGAPTAQPLIGRDDALAQLTDTWAHVRDGRGAVAVLSGEGGIGKTRLADELLTRAGAESGLTASCAALDLRGAPPFGMWAELLSALGRELPYVPVEATWPEELARIAPALPRLLGRAAPATPDVAAADVARARLFEAAVELLAHATTERPLVLLFEDVHLADDPSLELCSYVARRIATLPVLLVLTRRMAPRRDDVEALLLAALSRGVRTVELDLQPLSRAQVESLVTAIGALAAPLREQVIAAADGNPLLVIESARAALRGDEGPPSSLRAAVRAAVAPLPPPARRVTELAAVAARDLDRAELASLSHPSAVLAALDCGLLQSVDGRLGFRHALLREAVYAALDDAQRCTLHETLATTLDRRAAEAARHLVLAGRHDLAAGKLLQAAAEATRATAFAQAAAFQEEACRLAPDDPAPLLALAESYAVLGRRDPAAAALEAALERLDPSAHVARADALLHSARWYRGSLCDPTRGGDAARRGLDALGADDPQTRETRFELLAIRAWSQVTTAGADAAEATVADLERLGLDLEGHPLLRHHLDTVRGFALIARGQLAEAETVLVKSGEDGEQAGRPDLAYSGWANAACAAAGGAVASADAEALKRAMSYTDHAITLTRGLPTIELQLHGMRGYLLSRLGRREDARAAADAGIELAERIGAPHLCALAAHDAGLLALAAGDDERAAELLATALAGDAAIIRADVRLRRAAALARCGRPDEADAEIRAATQEPMRRSYRPAAMVARMAFAQGLSARARGDHALAERRLQESAEHWRRLAGPDGYAADHLGSLVDLGRPPVVGVLDPAYELARIEEELHAHV
jgi:DNA-binding SARP family transcriptional activator/tetratricopeptide (TPR) repeat protein